MANKIITARFTRCGCPATGLTPTIDVWELDPTNPGISVQIVTGAPMTSTFGAWYRYDITTYDYSKTYAFEIDGGETLPCNERYQFGVNESYEEDISFEVWEEPTGSHLTPATTGYILTFIRKMLTNRNRIDDVANTLTIYDDDGTTPLLVFNMKDFAGAPSINPAAERDPV
ncbi:MAG TPA: hypothetical protein VJ201_06360 [Candidatus Babeliales bacterium]|nr:hypothetical protein [Candidatus Babeliales bacterium]